MSAETDALRREIHRLKAGIRSEVEGALRVDPADEQPYPFLARWEQRDLRDRLALLLLTEEEADALKKVHERAEFLRVAWDEACFADERRGSEQTYAAEQRAFNALVYLLEANNLNGSKWDPR